MHWIQHAESTSARLVLAFSTSLLLTGAALAQQNTVPEAAQANQAAQLQPNQPASATPPAGATTEQPVQASAPAAPVKPWNVRCADANGGGQSGGCQMFQTLANPQGERVVAVSIRKQPQGLAMVMALPHGLHLPGGISYQVDSGQKKSVPIAASDAKGVYAVVPLDNALLGSMKRGNTFNVTMVGSNRRPVSIPMTLAGFTAAADELVAKQ